MNTLYLGEGAFAGENDALRALGGEELHGLGIRGGHLGRDVKSHAVFAAKRNHPPVGDDESVDIRFRGDDRLLDIVDLAFEHDGVQGEIAFDQACATPGDFGEVFKFEIDAAAGAHVEDAESEINGIGTGVNRGLQAGKIPGRGEYLGSVHLRNKKKEPAASYSRTGESRTTLGDEELDFRVRNGNGYDFFSMATGKKPFRLAKNLLLRTTRPTGQTRPTGRTRLTRP